MDSKLSAHNIRGPILALDLGEKRIGAAVSDELLISVRRLDPLKRASWKRLVADVTALVRRLDAKSIVIGLPLSLNDRAGAAAENTQQTAEKLSRSLEVPVYLHDEKLTSVEAHERLVAAGFRTEKIRATIDSESAAVILEDFIGSIQRNEHS
jgi:putative pre-16S rRNA nuclease